MSTWVFQSESGEILTVPFVMQGEIIKRLVGVTSGIVYSYGILSLINQPRQDIEKQMVSYYQKADKNTQAQAMATIKFTLDVINTVAFQKHAQQKTRATLLQGISVVPQFQLEKLKFSFKSQKLTSKDDNGVAQKTIKTKRAVIEVDEKIVVKVDQIQEAPKTKQKPDVPMNTIKIKRALKQKSSSTEQGQEINARMSLLNLQERGADKRKKAKDALDKVMG